MTEQAVRVEQSGPVTTVFLHRPAATPSTALPPPSSPRPSARSTPIPAPPSPCCTARAASSAPVPTSPRSAPSAATGSAPDGDGPMGATRLRLSKPVIAAVSGYAVAGGLELALWCDLRVADETAVFGVFCRRWGVPLIDGGTVRLPRLIGDQPGDGHDPHRPRR